MEIGYVRLKCLLPLSKVADYKIGPDLALKVAFQSMEIGYLRLKCL